MGNMTSAFKKTKAMLPIPVPFGSTAQGTAPNGARFYMEHVGPRKEDMVFYIVGANDEYTMSTSSQMIIGMRGINPSKLKSKKKAFTHIKFKDDDSHFIVRYNQM